jgi:aspartokinase-like uncharacterized kinase
VVVKVGGSLLDLPDLGPRIARLLAQRPGCRPVFLCGGGALVDVIRCWHETHRLREEDSHALAMRALDVTALLLTRLLPGGRLCKCDDEIAAAWRHDEWPVLLPEAWLNRSRRRARASDVPKSWDVTSDSLAAVVAQELEADELLLLKSAPCPPTPNVEAAADHSVVDRHFPRLSAMLKVITWVNLRTVGDAHAVHWLGAPVNRET